MCRYKCVLVHMCMCVVCDMFRSEQYRDALMLDNLGHREVKETSLSPWSLGPLHVSAVPSQADLEIHRETRASKEMPL